MPVEGKKWPLLAVRGETCSPDFTQLGQLDRHLGGVPTSWLLSAAGNN